MADNESLADKKMDVDQDELKLSPWLQKRMEERALPFNSQGLFTGLTSFVVRNQPFQRLFERSNRLSRVRLTRAISQTNRQPFLSKAMLDIISRTINTGTSSLYKILDLPWFRPRRSQREETIENMGYTDKRETDIEMNASTPEHRVLQASPELVDRKEYRRVKKTPEVYFERISSPPISRKKTRNIWEHTPSQVVVQGTPVEPGHNTKVYSPPDDLSHQHPASRIDQNISNQHPASRINQNISNQVVDREVVLESHTKGQASSDETTDGFLPRKEDEYERRLKVSGNNIRKPNTPQIVSAEKDVSQLYPVKELFYVKPLRAARKILQSLPFVRNTQSEVTPRSLSVAFHTDGEQDRQNDYDQPSWKKNIPATREITSTTPEPPDTSVKLDEHYIETEDGGTQDQKEILHESRRVESEKREKPTFVGSGDKGENTRYPVVNLFDDTRSQVTREPAQPLPSGDTLRKVVPPGPVQRGVEKSLPRQSVQRRTTRTTPQKPVRHSIDEGPPQKPTLSNDNKLPRQSIQRRVDEKPAQERNQLSVDETSSQEPVQFHADGTQIEINSGYQSEKNYDTQSLYEKGAGTNRPVNKLPLIPPVINKMRTEIARKAVLNGDIPNAMPEFGKAASHSLDLPLAPVSRIEIIPQREEYHQTGQTSEGPTTFRSIQNPQSTQTTPTGTLRTSITDSNEDRAENQEEKKAADYRTIAREIYPFIRRMIMIERERMLPR